MHKREKCKMLLSIRHKLPSYSTSTKNVFAVFYSCSFHISFRIQFSHFDNLLFLPFFSSVRLIKYMKKQALTAVQKKWKHINNIHRRLVYINSTLVIAHLVSRSLLLLTVLCVFPVHSSRVNLQLYKT
jgi:hypothetical protein